MLRSQELSLRISEIRQRLNELAGKDSLSAEERAEVDTLSAELSGKETQYRAAVQAEEAESREHRAAGDGEGAELRSLTGRVRCGEYLQAAVEQRAVSGAEAELNAAVGLAAQGRMPWAALLPRAAPEVRQDAATAAPATGIPTNQAEILERVFARSSTMYLRVDMPSVGVGESSFPVFTTGASAEQAAKGAAVDADVATFTPNSLKPKRLSAAYLWGVEDEAELRGLESALRDDLGMAMSDAMDKQVINGDGVGANVPGFLGGHADGLALTGAAAGAKLTFDSYRNLFLKRVDGLYAHRAGDVRLLVNPMLYAAAGVEYRDSSTDSDVSALDSVMELGGGFQSSANMPANDGDNRADVIACRGEPRAAVAPVWEGVRLIRDEVTGANKGQVRLTAIALWNFKIIRKAQYARLNCQSE